MLLACLGPETADEFLHCVNRIPRGDGGFEDFVYHLEEMPRDKDGKFKPPATLLYFATSLLPLHKEILGNNFLSAALPALNHKFLEIAATKHFGWGVVEALERFGANPQGDTRKYNEWLLDKAKGTAGVDRSIAESILEQFGLFDVLHSEDPTRPLGLSRGVGPHTPNPFAFDEYGPCNEGREDYVLFEGQKASTPLWGRVHDFYGDHLVHTIDEKSFWVCVDNKFTAHGTNEEALEEWEGFLDDEPIQTPVIPGDKYRDPYLEYEKPLHMVFGGYTNHMDMDKPHDRYDFDLTLAKARALPYEVNMLSFGFDEYGKRRDIYGSFWSKQRTEMLLAILGPQNAQIFCEEVPKLTENTTLLDFVNHLEKMPRDKDGKFKPPAMLFYLASAAFALSFSSGFGPSVEEGDYPLLEACRNLANVYYGFQVIETCRRFGANPRGDIEGFNEWLINNFENLSDVIGDWLTPLNICDNCNTPTDSDDNFCRSCGATL